MPIFPAFRFSGFCVFLAIGFWLRGFRLLWVLGAFVLLGVWLSWLSDFVVFWLLWLSASVAFVGFCWFCGSWLLWPLDFCSFLVLGFCGLTNWHFGFCWFLRLDFWLPFFLA